MGCPIALRRANSGDRERILEISSRASPRRDYISTAIDDWLAGKSGESVVALLNRRVVGFAHRMYLVPGYMWLEGIRVDPPYQRLGVAKAITRFFLDEASREKAHCVGLATETANLASLNLTLAHGFVEVAQFDWYGVQADRFAWEEDRNASDVVELPPEECLSYVLDSDFLAAAAGHLPHGWIFYPLDRATPRLLQGARDCIGIRRNGHLAGVLVGGPSQGGEVYSVDFADGDQEAVEILLRHVRFFLRMSRTVELMCPCTSPGDLPLMEALVSLGIGPRHGCESSVVLLELTL